MADAALAVTAADLTSQVQAAIDVGDLYTQQAPGGHPIFAALDKAREVLAWLQESGPLMASGVGSNVQQYAQGAIDGVYAALALIRNDPNAPLPRTLFPQVSALPWKWIAAGAGGILLVAILFQQQRGRRKR
jgi:hypothetical protein